ncbi:response regulator [Neomegalonema sp.]|uniref:response regulator n=1 Tax=Neomegalonema sp. TaxID=2039713 RepID=UPI002620B8D0|nr:response regulator [Neomegalonema sp.]MDD2868810.1 response regulator [Neomegalonema sp.]
MADFLASQPPSRPVGPGAGWRVALAAAAAGLGAGAAVWIGAAGPADPSLRVLLMSGAAALGAATAAGVGWSLDLARRGQNTLEAIYALEEAADAYVLVDDLGAALGANRAGRRLFAHVASGPGGRRRLAVMLGSDSDAEGRIYRLIRGALDSGAAEDAFQAPGGARFHASVSRLARGKGETLWRIRREEPAPAPVAEPEAAAVGAPLCADLPIGYYRADRGGALLEANPALLALAGRAPGDMPARLEDLFEEGAAALSPALAPENEEIRVGARLRGGGAAEVAQRLLRGPEGAAEAHGFVMRAARAQARAPGAPRLPQYFEAAPLAIAVADAEGLVIESNDHMLRLTHGALNPGASLAAAVKLEDRREFDAALRALAAGEAVKPFEAHLPDREGPPRIAQIFMAREGGDSGAILAYFIDVSEQRSLELKFAQSQKMQAIGQLVGNLAHDFNNLLTVIIGHCDLLLQTHEAGDPGFADINQVKQTANRGAALVRHLLAFSRQQTLKKRPVRLAEYFSENIHMLHRMSSERIRFEAPHYARDLWPVNIDPDAFFSVLMNLVINARDAMPQGGSIAISSRNVAREEAARLDNPILPPADYVLIEVRDTGTGIPRENLGKIFEPFFSTKGANGTGLGLASVYGAVKQMDGFVFVESELGQGTCFRIFLPRHAHEAAAEAALAPATRDLSGKGLILLVEDEAAVRSFASRALEVRGYQVLQAASGEEALELLADESQKIDLIISDVVMPNMDGPTLLGRIRELGRDTRILFISGYAEEAFRKNLRSGEEFLFLPKPFSLKDLALKVKQALS